MTDLFRRSAPLVLLVAGIAHADQPASGGYEATYTALLADHVTAGVVDYPALCGDPRLEQVTDGLAGTDPAALEGDAAMALWINAYNAWTLDLICDHWPVESINDLATGGRIIGSVLGRTAWDREIAVVGGTTYTLNHIEHEILRKAFDDFRVHFALVCAAEACPPLRSEAFVADRLDAQLDDQGRTFLRDASKNRFDTSTRTAHLSKIFKWFAEDFGATDAAVLTAIAPYLDESEASAVRADPGAWSIAYLEYDWSLNGPTSR